MDLPKFSKVFANGVQKADFLIFGDSGICEVKQLEAVNFPKRVSKLIGKLAENFKQDAYRAINRVLSKANGQIEETKKALSLPKAVGIVVLDHRIPSESSVLSAIDASDLQMRDGLKDVQAVLCVDVLNVFNDRAGNPMHLCQCVQRGTSESQEAAKICDQLLQDYLNFINHPRKDISITNPQHKWIFDTEKRFIRYEAGFESDSQRNA